MRSQDTRPLIAALYDNFHARHLRLYVNTPVGDDDFDQKFIADHSDGVLLMNFDEHQTDSGPGPDCFAGLVCRQPEDRAEDGFRRKRLSAQFGSYGYDWGRQRFARARYTKGTKKKAAPEKVLDSRPLSTQEAWQAASDSESQIDFDEDSLNAHFAYDDEDAHVRHQVWFLGVR